MRALVAMLALGVCACSQSPSAATVSPSPSVSAITSASQSPSPSPSPQTDTCRLPVWWPGGSSPDVHAAFVGIPSGTETDVGVLPLLGPTSTIGISSYQFYGGAYFATANTWLRVDSSLVSPDGRLVVWWRGTPSVNEIHELDRTNNQDKILYSGSILYVPIAVEADGTVYAVHAINLRQSAFEKLYRLGGPAGSDLTLVPGSDRPMYQTGWSMIADGVAWGVYAQASGSDFDYTVIGLDLVTGHATSWMQSQTAS